METKKKKVKIGDILLYSFFLLIFFIVIVVVLTRVTTGSANFFGLRIYSIQTNSMAPEYPAGSLILETINFKPEELKKGDIITFDMNIDNYNVPNTHRIVGFYYIDKETDERLETYDFENINDFYQVYDINHYEIIGFKTKGDNPEANIDINPVLFEDLEAKFIAKLHIIAFIYNLVMKPWGFVLIVLIPMLTILVVQVISTIKKAKEKDDDDIKKTPKELEEEIAKKAIEEYLKNHPELK